MQLLYTDDRYVARSIFEERFLPKSAGFRWDPQEKAWWTQEEHKAMKLAEYAVGTAADRMKEAATRLRESRELSRAANADFDIPVPDGLEYLPYQRAGIRYASGRPATLIADEMGLGKSIQSIGVINGDPTVKRVLVVCPASLKINWKRELEKWLTRDMTVGIADSQGIPVVPIVVINYDMLGKYKRLIEETKYDLLVVDECHFCKNPDARRSKMVYAIRAKRRLFLTGTPIVNRPKELWPLLHALDPATWNSWWAYAMRYCGAKNDGWGWDFSGASHLEELQDRLRSTIMVRRLKRDVLQELPPKVRQVIEIPANGNSAWVKEENRRYEASQDSINPLRARVELAKASDRPEDYEEAVKALRQGQQVSFNEVANLLHETAMRKLPYVIEHVREAAASSGKVIVFAHHLDVINALVEAFGAECVQIQGCTPQIKRQEAVDRFQSDSSVKIFVGSLTAAGVGLTLTASRHVIFAELDWVPGNLSQAEDRAHRIGQVNSVLVQHLVLEGSVDATMARTVLRKQAVIDTALNKQVQSTPKDKDMDWAKQRVVNAEEHKAEENKVLEKTRFKREEVAREALTLSPEQIGAAHHGLQFLFARCDGAAERDGQGFSKTDTYLGHALAGEPSLSAKQAVIARRLCRRYHRQLPESTLALLA